MSSKKTKNPFGLQKDKEKESGEISEDSNTSSNSTSISFTPPNESENIVISLQLGDVIKFEDPQDDILNNNTFIIDYIDTNIIKLINVDELSAIQLKINPGGIIGAGTITSIDLLYRNEAQGYARQNNLLPETWINVYFGGDTPVVITGKITNIEEDMIEITVYPDNDVLYINFGYKGIPLDLPIETIEIRKPPEKAKTKSKEALLASADIDSLDEYGSELQPFFDDDNEEFKISPTNVKNQLKEIIIRADEVHFGRELAPITQFVDVGSSQQRYTIEAQTNDLLDELLSKIPNSQRTAKVLNNIHIMIERFKQLRLNFSEFDDYGNVTSALIKGADWKPLVNNLLKMRMLLFWILPVVKNIKKVYNINSKEETEYPDVIPFITSDDIQKMEETIQNYESNNLQSQQNKYANFINDINPFFTPFEEVNPELSNDILYSFNVVTELNAIVDNLGDFYSSVAQNESIKTRKFVIQKYNTSLSRLEATQLTASKMVAHRVKIGNSDRLELKSIMTLPEPTIRFSNINLPGSSIMQKANLNTFFLNYWQLLKQRTNVQSITIDDIENELQFDENNFVNNIKSYNLLLREDYSYMKKKEIYDKYLNVIIPKTRILFNLIKKYINGKLSVYDIVGYLEPFLIYTDDLTYMQFKEISKFLDVKVSEYNKKFTEKSKAFSILKKIDAISNKPNDNNILNLLVDSRLKNDVFDNCYNINNSEITNSEAITNITKFDFGNVFYNSISLDNIDLLLSQDVSSFIERQQKITDIGVENMKENNKCITFTTAKQYSNVDELNADNGKTIYFDRKYDDTVYSLLENYEKDQIKMDPDEFKDFLIDKLQSKHKYNPKDAEYMADTLINGVKQVVNGNIAIIYDFIGEKNNYYRRINNRWELDETINEEVLNSNANNNNLLCNFQNNCIEVEEKFGAAQCESYDLNKKELQQKTMKSIVDEFDKSYQTSQEDLKIKINQRFDYYFSIVVKLKEIQSTNLYKYNEKQYKLGASLEDSTASSDQVKYSPYFKLRDMILGQTDFIKKQYDIVRFTQRFTREPVASEDEHWYYCFETNTKLLPNFLYILASQFIKDSSNYTKKMDEIIKTNGTISDDGDAWVDKFSGYVIRLIDYDVDEGYDDGFKISSREIMEQDAGDAVLLGSVENKKVKYQSVETQMAFNVITAMAVNMGINIEEQKEFILKIFNNSLGLALPNESEYAKRASEAAKRGKNLPEYKKIYNVTILYLSLGALLIGIQTSIPSVKTRKTFPGCVRSFIGFPFDGAGDFSSLNYLACIAYKIRKAGDDPWSGFSGVKETTISTKIKETIETYYLNNVDVIQKFKEKTDYLLTNPNEDIPTEHDLSKWLNFLPPIVPFKLKPFENISPQFKGSFLRDLNSGSREQREKMLIIESKIIFFSLAIQEKIQKVVSKKHLLLNNSINEPFIENACCNNDRNETNALSYFEKEESDIKQFNEIVQQLSNIIYDINHITEAPYLFSNENTKNIYPILGDDFNEETIYRAFITYCRFNSLISLDEDLIAICTDKPNFLNISDSISEKIRKLKHDGRIYDDESLLRLLQIVARKNIIPISLYDDTVTPVQKIKGTIEYIRNAHDDGVVPASLIQNIDTILDTFDIAVDEDTEEMRSLKNYLARSNGELKKEIMDFLIKYGKLTKKDREKTKKFLEQLIIWEDLNIHDTTTVNIHDNDEQSITDNALYNIIDFFKTYLQNILKIFPNIILNSVDYKNVWVPSYLGLSAKHTKDIKGFVAKYYDSLSPFYKNKLMLNVLTNIQPHCEKLLLLSINTPAFTDIKYKDRIQKSIFDRKTSLLLFENYFLQAIMEYIRLSSDESMLVREAPVREDAIIDAQSLDNDEDMEQRLGFTGTGYSLLDRSTLSVQIGNLKDLKEKTAELILCYLNIMSDHKNTIDFSYGRIMDLVFKTREKEKDTFTDRLKDKTDEERNVDTLLKINKLGEWSKGLQKGLTSYVKENYDEERDYMEELAQIERKVMKNKSVTDRNASQFLDDFLEEKETEDLIDREESDIAYLDEDNMDEQYMDGEYQGENDDNEMAEHFY